VNINHLRSLHSETLISIRTKGLVLSLNEKSAYGRQFLGLLPIRPANILHILDKRIFVSLDGRRGLGGHPVR